MGVRPLLSDPRGHKATDTERGGGGSGPWPAPADPATHIGKIFLGQKMKFIEGAGNLRPILGAQPFFWPLTHPRGGGSATLSNGLMGVI